MNAEFSEGDLIEATKGETALRGRVYAGVLAPILQLGYANPFVHKLADEGFTLTLIEKATPPLPTEPGWYRSSGMGADLVDGLLHLGARGDWTWVGNMFAVNPDPLTDKQARHHLPLTRLEPVADTAKRVLDEVASYWPFGAPPAVNEAIKAAADVFGVTS